MLDTYILALKKKPLTFLQMYHHFIVVILCWVLLDSGWPLHWVAVVANTTVHVFMYYYFSLSALGVNVWWKKVCRSSSPHPHRSPLQFLTAGQLLQFSIVFTLIQVWMYISFTNFRWTFVPVL